MRIYIYAYIHASPRPRQSTTEPEKKERKKDRKIMLIGKISRKQNIVPKLVMNGNLDEAKV